MRILGTTEYKFASNIKRNTKSNKSQNQVDSNLNFKSSGPNYRTCYDELARMGVRLTTYNLLIAQFGMRITKTFKRLFPENWLKEAGIPKILSGDMADSCNLGTYNPIDDCVNINPNSGRFNSELGLMLKTFTDKRLILPDAKSTIHPAQVFAHEYAHCAHWKHLKYHLGDEKALQIWQDLAGVMVPTVVGRLITRYNLGNYAVDSEDMCEFMAERVSKDVCNKLTFRPNWEFKTLPDGRHEDLPDVMYENIFERRWNYRYTSPQSYLDYYTQQVWNGDIEEANEAADRIKDFLEKEPKKEDYKIAIRYAPVRVLSRLVSNQYNKQKAAIAQEMKHITPATDIHPTMRDAVEIMWPKKKKKYKERYVDTTQTSYQYHETPKTKIQEKTQYHVEQKVEPKIETKVEEVKREEPRVHVVAPDHTQPAPESLSDKVFRHVGAILSVGNRFLTQELDRRNDLRLQKQ